MEDMIPPNIVEVETGQITTKELDDAIRKLKKNKAPGTYYIPSELFKWLDGQSRKHILATPNDCWRNERLICK